jgi:large subunit ribosomal protein L18
MTKSKQQLQHQRQIRVRSRLFGTDSRPRLTVFRSNKHIAAQIISDQTKKTIVAANDTKLTSTTDKLTKIDKAKLVGQELAKAAQKHKVTRVAFDRGHYKFHGRVKALAEAARQAGLEF